MDKTAYHPRTGLSIVFNEKHHTYIDGYGNHYKSGTTFNKAFFPPFDGDRIALEMSVKEGRPVGEIKAEWSAAGVYGTKCHEHAEWLFTGQGLSKAPNTEKEHIAFLAIATAYERLIAKYRFIGAEQIVFSPRYYIAGTIDLIMFDPGRNVWLLLDWKSNKAIYTEGFDGAKALHPISHLGACQFDTYSMQLALYERIAREEGYITPDSTVERALIHLPPMSPEPVWMPIPDRQREIAECLLWHVTDYPRFDESAETWQTYNQQHGAA